MTASMMMLRLCGLLLICSSLIDAKLGIINSDPDIQVGQETLLLCKADSEGDFSWLKDDEEIDEDRHVVEKIDESSSKLILKNVELNDAGNYTCVFENDQGQRKITYQIYVYQTLDFGNTSVYHEFLVNQTVEIPCEVSGQPAVEILWFRNGSIINDDGRGNLRILSDKSLQISGIQQEDSGNYMCVGRIKGRPTERRLQISVDVNEPPTVLIDQDTKRVLAGPDTTVSITCRVKGVPRPNISWILPSTSDESRHKYSSDKSELTISAVTRRDFGKYVCKATNKIGEDSDTFTLDVSVSQPALGKGGVVGIVMFIFLVLMVSVDAFCCYTKHCGLLNFLAHKIFGYKISVSKGLDEEANNSTGDVKLGGLTLPRGSIPKLQSPSGAVNGAHSEVTCDKAPLTKFEKKPESGDPAAEA